MRESAKQPVWDLPTRLFHWGVVLLIGLSYWSAKNAFEPWHFWSGYAILFLLLFRILWGFFGSSTARFANFVRGPADIFRYLRARRWPMAGHTPLGALSVVAMLLALIFQVGTGLIQIDSEDFVEGPLSHLVSFETAEAAHEIHEASFNVLLALIALHLAAIVFYRLVLGRRLVGPMVTGHAELEAGVPPLTPAPAWRAWACAAAALIATAWIATGAPPFGP
ncbi:MAG TPA: cytochrome b/b6 domain-containing protein [Sphingomicrobium sp.]|nr:cytochrome b/b6 domain-containing protein [Sphingomicrobium sp.]